MSSEEHIDWKVQFIDMIDAFAMETGSRMEGASKFLLNDIGQENLFLDAIKPLFSTMRFKRGDTLTAIELGRIYGHWRELWTVFAFSDEFLAALQESHSKTSGIREKLDEIIKEHMPGAEIGIETGIFHLLSVVNDPTTANQARARRDEFAALCKTVEDLVRQQSACERKSFFKGFGEAIANNQIGPDGQPENPDKISSLLAYLRPFAVRCGLSAAEFQEALGLFAPAQATGNPERFAKHLQRRKASLRGKGRPAKKSAKVGKSKREKSDKN